MAFYLECIWKLLSFLAAFEGFRTSFPAVGAANDRWTTPANYSVGRVLAAGRARIDRTA